jgi:SH3 domain protein
MKKTILPLLLLMLSPLGWGAPKSHISDEIKVFVHTGPSNQYRISGQISSGNMVTVLQHNKAAKYTHIGYGDNKKGWVETKFIESGESLKARLPVLERDLSDSLTLVQEQAAEVSELKVEVEEVDQSRTQAASEVSQLKNRIDSLQAEIDGMDESNMMGWFLRGAAVAFAGLVIGLIIPKLPKRRSRNDEWF